jgi:hypothetical protein
VPKVLKLKLSILLVICLICLAGCSTAAPRLPSGMYRSDPASNFINVTADQMCVHIEGVDARDTDGNGLPFAYALAPEGRVVLRVRRSAELLNGYPALDYRWGNEKIIVTDSKSGSQWVFLRAEN